MVVTLQDRKIQVVEGQRFVVGQRADEVAASIRKGQIDRGAGLARGRAAQAGGDAMRQEDFFQSLA